MHEEQTKVHWELEQDEDDWPPFAVETIWCAEVIPHMFRLLNVPYFAKGISWGDVVKVKEMDGNLWYESVEHRSDYSTIHIFCFDDEKLEKLKIWARENDCVLEAAFKRKYFALGIPSCVPKEKWLVFLKNLESLDEDGFEFDVAFTPTSSIDDDGVQLP